MRTAVKRVILISLINIFDIDMLHTTLRQMEVFVATAREGSVTHAATALGMTQSAASMALADFENQLGTRLFDRLGKRLSLNEEGRSLYAKAVEIIERVQELENFGGRTELAASLRLGASSTIGNYILPQLIGKFSSLYPGSRFQLEVGNTQHVVDAVRNFKIDVGFVEGPCLDAEIEPIFWQHDELAIAVAPDHPLASVERVDAQSLREAHWILRERGSGTREVVEQLLTRQLGEIRLAMELGGSEAIKRAVEAGMGISCLPKVVLSGAVERGNLVILNTPFLELKRDFHIILHKQKYRTKGMLALLELCHDKAQL